jgi:uncharacterized membrane protein YqjE
MGAGPERSVAELFAELATETTTLVRKEFELARAELSHNVSKATSGVVLLVVGALVAMLGLQALIACAILVLTRWVDPWQSALIVGAAALVIAGILVAIGRARLDLRTLTPRRTLATLRRDGAWAKEQLNERI